MAFSDTFVRQGQSSLDEIALQPQGRLNKVYAYKCSAYFLLVYIMYMKYKMHIHCFVYMDFKYIFHLCTRYIAYSSSGNAKHLLRRGKVNIKKRALAKICTSLQWISNQIIKACETQIDYQDMNESATYQYLCDVRPDGDVVLTEEETKDFENWLGIWDE